MFSIKTLPFKKAALKGRREQRAEKGESTRERAGDGDGEVRDDILVSYLHNRPEDGNFARSYTCFYRFMGERVRLFERIKNLFLFNFSSHCWLR